MLLCHSLLENVTPAAARAHHHQPVLFTTASVAVQREALFAVQRHHQGLPAIVKSSHAPKTSDPWGFAAAGTPVSMSHLSGRVALAISAGLNEEAYCRLAGLYTRPEAVAYRRRDASKRTLTSAVEASLLATVHFSYPCLLS